MYLDLASDSVSLFEENPRVGFPQIWLYARQLFVISCLVSASSYVHSLKALNSSKDGGRRECGLNSRHILVGKQDLENLMRFLVCG